MRLRVQIACYELKGDLSPCNAFRKYFMKVLKISKLQGFVWKTMQARLDGKSCFSHTSASNFRRLLQSLLLRHTAENSQVT